MRRIANLEFIIRGGNVPDVVGLKANFKIGLKGNKIIPIRLF